MNVCDGPGGYRNVVIVDHSVKNDIRILRDLIGFDINNYPPVVAVLDTQQIVQHVFPSRSYSSMSLQGALPILGLPSIELHMAGNDALYTLKLMLLLFYQYKHNQSQQAVFSNQRHEEEELQTLWECQLLAIQRLGRCFWRAPTSYKKQSSRVRPKACQKQDLLDDECDETGICDLVGLE